MPEKRDYYEVLGLSRDATLDHIKKSYKKLAMQYHPDRNPGDPSSAEKFKEATEAYEILSNTEKREAYDRYGFAGVQSDFSRVDASDFGSMSDLFSSLFGDDLFGSFFGGRRGTRQPSGPQKGSDLIMNYEISFDEAIYGTNKVIDVPIKKECASCNGKGTKSGASPKKCSTCNGSGVETVSVDRGFTRYISQQMCSRCNGKGEMVNPSDVCSTCRGTGRSSENEKIKLTIPMGVDSGHRLRIRGKGEDGKLGGPRGDLIIRIIVEEHHFYKRQGSDLAAEIFIPYPLALLGGDFVLPTPYGSEKIKIPKQTKDGTVLRLKGKGVKRETQYGLSQGNLHLVIRIDIPNKLSSDEKKLLEELLKVMRPSKEQDSLFEKLIKEANEKYNP